jgi:hypothetical protein
MSELRMNDSRNAIEIHVARALETRPEVSVPDGFAARVARAVPARKVAAVTPARYGLIAMRIAAAVLVVALVLTAMHFTDRSATGVSVEWILCGQLVALALWRSGMWRRGVSEV